MRPSRFSIVLIAISSIGCQYSGSRLVYCPQCGRFHQVAVNPPASLPQQAQQPQQPASTNASPQPGDPPPIPFVSGNLDSLEAYYSGRVPSEGGAPKRLEPFDVKQALNHEPTGLPVIRNVATAGEPVPHN